jgi:hypothetical protein
MASGARAARELLDAAGRDSQPAADGKDLS